MSIPRLDPTGFAVWEERAPDETRSIAVPGGSVVAYSYGEGPDTLFLLNGGPGLPCDYWRDPHLPLVAEDWRIVVHDQLGTGASDHPDDPALWTMARYVAEVEAVLDAFGLASVHFVGHSWGGWCGIEWALTHPGRVASMVLANTCADIPHLLTEIARLRDALGPETVAMMQRFEAEGRFDHPAYEAAVRLLDYRHIRRQQFKPDPVRRSHAGFNRAIFEAIQGPNEYCYTGLIRDWRRIDEIGRFAWPVLVATGTHDVLTPACAARMARAIPGAEIVVFPDSAHSPAYEAPRAWRAALGGFLRRAAGRA